MNTNTDILIIGGGVIGASIFYHLARDGHRVTLLEKNNTASGCTEASAGIVRCFHLNPSWSDKSVYGSNYYRAFQHHTGQSIDIKSCGFIFIPHQDNLHRSKMQVQRLAQNIQIEWLSKSKIKKQFKHIFKNIPENIVYEPDAFYISSIATTMAWLKAGQAFGGNFYESTHVRKIYSSGGCVEIITSFHKLIAKKVVIAAGAQTPDLLDQLGYQHSLFKKNIRLDVRKATSRSGAHPAFIDETTGLYGRADINSEQFYIGLPTNNVLSTGQHSEVIYQHGSNRFNWIEDSVLKVSLQSDDCYSQDGVGCITALNENKTIYLASGFSGGGFKIAPWVGYETALLIKQTR